MTSPPPDMTRQDLEVNIHHLPYFQQHSAFLVSVREKKNCEVSAVFCTLRPTLCNFKIFSVRTGVSDKMQSCKKQEVIESGGSVISQLELG